MRKTAQVSSECTSGNKRCANREYTHRLATGESLNFYMYYKYITADWLHFIQRDDGPEIGKVVSVNRVVRSGAGRARLLY